MTRLSVVFPTATSPSSLNTSSRGGFVHVCKASSRRVIKWCVRAAGLEKLTLFSEILGTVAFDPP